MSSSIAMPADLFPLSLSPFEYYYWCDDRPEYPTTFPIELVFSPPLGRAEFERALELTVARHPLLSSLVAEDRRNGPCWIGGGRIVAVDWAVAETASEYGDGQRIDLSRDSGLRIWALDTADSTRVHFQFHHACCDGLGAFRFLSDLLIAYARECGGRTDELSPAQLDQALLRRRAELDVPTPTLWTTLRDWCVGGQFWGKFACQAPVPLSEKADVDGANRRLRGNRVAASRNGLRPTLRFSSRSLDHGFSSRMRLAAKRSGCAINDILLCGLFLAVRNWNARQGRLDGLLRINMPVTVRDRGNANAPVANSLSFAFLNRHARECDVPAKLLQGICRETQSIKRLRLGLYFVGGLGTFRGVPGLIPWFLRQPRCRATVVLSNIGRLFARMPLPRKEGRLICGKSMLESVEGVPPIRPLTRASLIATNYAGRMAIHGQCDPHCFDREGQEEFLSQYMESLEEVVGTQAG
jgi:hypothetical protein